METFDLEPPKKSLLKNVLFWIGVIIVGFGLYGAFKKVQIERAKSKMDKESLEIVDDWQNHPIEKVVAALHYLHAKGEYIAYEKSIEMEKTDGIHLRSAAVKIIASYPSEASYQILNRMYYDKSKQVRMSLIRGLGDSGHKRYLKWLQQLKKDLSLSLDERLEAHLSAIVLVKIHGKSTPELMNQEILDVEKFLQSHGSGSHWLKALRILKTNEYLFDMAWKYMLNPQAQNIKGLARFMVISKAKGYDQPTHWKQMWELGTKEHQEAFVLNLPELCFLDRKAHFQKILFSSKNLKVKLSMIIRSLENSGEEVVSALKNEWINSFKPEIINRQKQRAIQLTKLEKIPLKDDPCGTVSESARE